MKKIFILFLIVFFIFVFFQSKTLEIREVVGTGKSGKFSTTESHSRRVTLHWDRFLRYLKELPDKIF